MNPCEAVVPLPSGCTTTQCEAAGCSAFQHTSDGAFCYAAGDVNSLSASFLDPSSGVVGSPSQGITLSWGSPLSTCGTGGIFRQTVLRLICGSGQAEPGQGAFVQHCRFNNSICRALSISGLAPDQGSSCPPQIAASIKYSGQTLPVALCQQRGECTSATVSESTRSAFPSIPRPLAGRAYLLNAVCCATLQNKPCSNHVQIFSHFLQRRWRWILWWWVCIQFAPAWTFWC